MYVNDSGVQVDKEHDVNNYIEVLEYFGNNKNIILPRVGVSEKVCDVRRPVYYVRGKSLAREQVIDVFSHEEPLFRGWDITDLNSNEDYLDIRSKRGVLKNCFYRRGYSWLDTWLFSDGTVGGNNLSFKYPYFNEFLPEWLVLGERYPYLDIAVGYSIINESKCHFCPYVNWDIETNDYDFGSDFIPMEACCNRKYVDYCKQFKGLVRKYSNLKIRTYESTYEYKYGSSLNTKYFWPDIPDFIDITIVISQGKTQVYFGEEAIEHFREYYNKYNDDDLQALYDCSIFNYKDWHIFNKQFIKDCFKNVGLQEECYEIAVKNKFISDIPDDMTFVTAEFIRKQHRDMFKKYGIEEYK